jgi:signal transduction histidine kinase
MANFEGLTLKKLIFYGTGLIAFVWILDSVVDYFRNPTVIFWKYLISTNYDDILVRSIVIILTIFLVFISNKYIRGRIEYENQLKKHHEDLKRVSYFVIHDLKSPAIANFGLLKRLNDRYGEALDNRGQELCRIIMDTSKEILELVEELNSFVKTKENRINVQTVSVNDLVQSIKDQVAIELTKRNIKCLGPAQEAKIRSDPFLLQRAIKNLVINALKHGGENLSEIKIEFKKTEKNYQISVSDNGKGIKTDKPETLFDPFERLDESIEIEGIGIGLVLAKEVATKHGGSVWFKPNETGGVTFYLSIARGI